MCFISIIKLIQVDSSVLGDVYESLADEAFDEEAGELVESEQTLLLELDFAANFFF